MPGARRSSSAALIFAWCGAALFALALLFFLYDYLVRFGASAAGGSAAPAAAFNLLLFSLFALHHSLLARSGLKARVQHAVGAPLERAVYTWTASVLFLMVCWWWQPLPGTLYSLTGVAAVPGIALQVAGIVLTAAGSARLDVLDLAGVRPVLEDAGTRAPEHRPLETTGLYGLVRHPVYLAWVLFVFGAPHMTMTRLMFAVVSTAYLVVAIPLEERSLIRAFGAAYRQYQQRVRWRMIPGVY